MVALPKSFVRTEPGERIERRDFEHAIYESQRALVESLINDVVIGEPTPSNSIPSNTVISGFPTTASGSATPGAAGVVTYTGSGSVTVTRGRAIVGVRVNGQIEFGIPVSSGDSSRSQDISGLSDGTYGVYIRVEFRDDEFQNRVFWNPLAATPVETTRRIATRRVENWGMSIAAVSPGAEYLLIAQVAKTGTTFVVTDRREMLLDVSSNDGSTDTIVDADWGGGTDRNDDRRTNGIGGLYTFVKAVQRQLQDIIGTKWYDTIPRSLTALNTNKLERDGTQTITGDLTINADLLMNGSIFPTITNVNNIGSATFRWLNSFFNLVDLSANAPGTLGANDRIYANTIVRGWGHVVTDGAGGITTQDGVGYSATISATEVRITLDQSMFNATEWVLIPTAYAGVGDFCNVGNKTAAAADIFTYDRSTGIIDAGAVVVAVNFIIVGRRV